jgi:GH18 family chitinase
METYKQDECTKAGWKRQNKLVERINKLKEGDLLWQIIYWGGEDREIRKFKVKKIKGEIIHLVYWGFKFKKQKILDKELFLSLKEALIDKIELQKETVKENEYNLKGSLKELNYLKSKLNSEKLRILYDKNKQSK